MTKESENGMDFPDAVLDGVGRMIAGTVTAPAEVGVKISQEVRAWIEIWQRSRRGAPQRILDQELRDPRFRFRETSRLATRIDDKTTGHVVTRALLRGMGAYHNTKENGRDTWSMLDYWEEIGTGGTTILDNGKYRLKPRWRVTVHQVLRALKIRW